MSSSSSDAPVSCRSSSHDRCRTGFAGGGAGVARGATGTPGAGVAAFRISGVRAAACRGPIGSVGAGGIPSEPCVGPRTARVASTRSILRASRDVNPVAITVIFSSSPLRGRSAGRRALPRAGRLAAAGGQKSSYRSRIRG